MPALLVLPIAEQLGQKPGAPAPNSKFLQPPGLRTNHCASLQKEQVQNHSHRQPDKWETQLKHSDALDVGGKILISLSWHLCCPALKSSLGKGKMTSSMEEDSVTQPALHLVGNHWEEKASLIPTGN